jgi:hypothetical protein
MRFSKIHYGSNDISRPLNYIHFCSSGYPFLWTEFLTIVTLLKNSMPSFLIDASILVALVREESIYFRTG